ncbi:MAG: hypothetical protein AABW59_03385 [archaeon]
MPIRRPIKKVVAKPASLKPMKLVPGLKRKIVPDGAHFSGNIRLDLRGKKLKF